MQPTATPQWMPILVRRRWLPWCRTATMSAMDMANWQSRAASSSWSPGMSNSGMTGMVVPLCSRRCTLCKDSSFSMLRKNSSMALATRSGDASASSSSPMTSQNSTGTLWKVSMSGMSPAFRRCTTWLGMTCFRTSWYCRNSSSWDSYCRTLACSCTFRSSSDSKYGVVRRSLQAVSSIPSMSDSTRSSAATMMMATWEGGYFKRINLAVSTAARPSWLTTTIAGGAAAVLSAVLCPRICRTPPASLVLDTWKPAERRKGSAEVEEELASTAAMVTTRGVPLLADRSRPRSGRES
mmetsp:Transcript_13215/g.37255  ORF Transcript_13215/g.37255 Transcript_13215/m.37255 type:complete len:295 (-) Transcript_13215:2437-3321(-)